MKKFDEEKIVADLYLNLKGNKLKKDNWIDIATNVKRLCEYYGSQKKTAEKLGVSYELVRSISNLLKLPEEVQRLIKEKEILYDTGQRLQRIDPAKQVEVARVIAGMNSDAAREVIQYAKKFPNDDLKGFKKRLLTKIKTRKIHLAILPISEETYEILHKTSLQQNVSVERLIVNIIKDWLNKEVKT